MNHLKLLFTAMLSMVMTIAPLQASDTNLMSFGVGVYDINGSAEATDFRIEFRSGRSLLLEHLKPWVGAEVTSDSSVWVGAGLLYDFRLGEQWHLVPSLGVGLYDRGSSDLDLGHSIEFRSQLEVAYAFANQHRVALAISHLSNANLDKLNPGAEVLNLYWQLPY